MSNVVVIGTTAWGTTLAVLLARKGGSVRLWARTEVEAATLRRERQNAHRLPGVVFPDGMGATADLEAALTDAELVVLAVPSQRMRENARRLAPLLRPGTLVLSAAKGVEIDTVKRMSEVLAEELPPVHHGNVGVLSGPNLSDEVVRGLPMATVVAAGDAAVATKLQGILITPSFRVYTTTDVVGVELAGALKNIIAIGAGMSDGFGYGDNAKAAFMTRGLAEITRLGVAAGAHPLTFAGLAGVGDLIATCCSRLSRNRFVGEELAKGRSLDDIIMTLGQVAEGVPTTTAACQLARRLGVEMPIIEGTYRVLFEGYDVETAIAELMGRPAKSEWAGIGGRL